MDTKDFVRSCLGGCSGDYIIIAPPPRCLIDALPHPPLSCTSPFMLYLTNQSPDYVSVTAYRASIGDNDNDHYHQHGFLRKISNSTLVRLTKNHALHSQARLLGSQTPIPDIDSSHCIYPTSASADHHRVRLASTFH